MNKEEFAQIVMDSKDSLFRVSFSILGNETDCEDAVGEAITLAFTKLNTLKQEQYAKTWLIKILIRECYKVLRHKKRAVLSDEEMDELFEFENYEEKAEFYELYAALDKLSKEERTVVTLFYFEDYSIKEISRITRSTTGTVKSRLSRARKHLKDLL